MSRDAHRFNIFTTPATSGAPMISYGGGNSQPQPGAAMGGGTPINFYFQGRNNNVDIRVFPGPGSNIHIHGSETDDVLRNPERFLPFPEANGGDMDFLFGSNNLGGRPSHEQQHQQWTAAPPNGPGYIMPGNQLMPPPATPTFSSPPTPIPALLNGIQADGPASAETGAPGQGPKSTSSASSITRAIRSSERNLRGSKATAASRKSY